MNADNLPEIERAKRVVAKLATRTLDAGCTEAEALQSSEKITELLIQFDLTLDECLIREERCVQRLVFADDDMAGGIARGIARLCSLVYYRTRKYDQPTYVLFGFERDIELAVYLYEVLMEALATEWGEFVRVHGYARKKRDSFRMGFATRVCDRLTELREKRDREHLARQPTSDSRDLVLVRDQLVDEEFEKTGVQLVTGRTLVVRDASAYWRGDAAGQRAQINAPVNGEAKSLLEDDSEEEEDGTLRDVA